MSRRPPTPKLSDFHPRVVQAGTGTDGTSSALERLLCFLCLKLTFLIYGLLLVHNLPIFADCRLIFLRAILLCV